MSRLTCRKGFTLMELTIVLTVVGIIVGGIWVYAGQANEKSRQNHLEQQILTTLGNIKRVFPNSSTIPGVGSIFTADAIRAGIFPADMVRGTTVVNAMNGVVNIGTTSCSGSPCVRLAHDIPTTSCIGILSRFAGNPEMRRQLGIVAFGHVNNFISFDTNPMTPEQIVSACAASNPNPLQTFYIYITP